MDKAMGRLTVFFEDPFWVGLFERISDGQMSVCKVTFGGEPKDYEVLAFILRKYDSLEFSPSVAYMEKMAAVNPKRKQRMARKQTLQSGIGTKSQQALQLQREKMKTERKKISREQKEVENQRMFELKQQKRKEKHRGR